MNFIVIVACLAIERWTTAGKQIRSYQLLEKYIRFILASVKSSKFVAWFNLIVVLLPLMFLAGLFYVIFLQFFAGLIGFLFSLAILFYCLGPFPTVENNLGLDYVLVQTNRNIFSVLFWFGLLGPMGAIMYRVNNLLVSENIDELSAIAEHFQTILEWIPVRLQVLSYALVSHFKTVISCFMKRVFAGLNENEQLLTTCGHLALESDVADINQEMITLVDRALIVWLVAMALAILL